MPIYRLDLLGHYGQVVSSIELEYEDDEAAVAHIAAHLWGGAAELWRGTVSVRRFLRGELDG